MLIEAARRAETAAKEMLALVNDGAASSSEMRQMLSVSKATMAIMAAAQTGAASIIAKSERHGDGGAQVLADAAGLSRRDAHSQVNTARAIETVPAVRDALESGRVSLANAKRLAEAVEKTSAADVESDAGLLAKAESMRPEQFTKEARRWAVARQGDGGEADYRRLRARRHVRVWDSDDGTVELHGKFDPVAGRRIGNRLRAEARRLYDTDKKQAGAGGDAQRRSFDQCMADALDGLTANKAAGNAKPFADICVVAHVDEDTGKLIAELPNGARLPQAVLEELACNARFTGVVYDRHGKPIWRVHSVRTATEAQRQILLARHDGCFHCGANPAICQIHHIEPVSQGGTTSIDNMVPICGDDHHRIHYDGWQIHKRADGQHTLHPPDRVHYGPAHAPEDPRHLFEPEPRPTPDPPAPATPVASSAPRSCTAAPTTPDLPAPATPVAAVCPTGRPGPETARAALRTARAARDGPGPANPTEQAPSNSSLRPDRLPNPPDEPLFASD